MEIYMTERKHIFDIASVLNYDFEVSAHFTGAPTCLK